MQLMRKNITSKGRKVLLSNVKRHTVALIHFEEISHLTAC